METIKKTILGVSIMAAGLLSASCASNTNSSALGSFVGQDMDGIKVMSFDGFNAAWIRDNAAARKNPVSLFAGATEEMAKELGIEDGINSSMSAFLVEKDGVYILFDAGMGSNGSMLLPSLGELGITADEISEIYITHMHGDHIGGLIKDGEAVFTNAEIYLNKDEYEAWANMEGSRGDQAKQVFAAYEDRVNTFSSKDRLAHDIYAIEAPGHTPGHTVYQIGNLLIGGDIMHGVTLQMSYPELNASYDMDGEKAIESRVKVINYVKENNLVFCGMHFPEPGFIE